MTAIAPSGLPKADATCVRSSSKEGGAGGAAGASSGRPAVVRSWAVAAACFFRRRARSISRRKLLRGAQQLKEKAVAARLRYQVTRYVVAPVERPRM